MSIYGETIRQKIKEYSTILTDVNTEKPLADVLAKPTSAIVNDRFYPLWCLIPRAGEIKVNAMFNAKNGMTKMDSRD